MCVEGTVNPLRFLPNIRAGAIVLAAAALCLTYLFTIPAFAQGSMSPYQDEQDGVSAGGKWMSFQSVDKMTGKKRVRFELVSNNYFKEDPDYKPRVELFCEDGKLKTAEFNPGVRLPPPNRPGFWGQPQLEAEIRVDDAHYHHGWNWQGRYVSMDKGTARGMVGAHIFNIAIPTRSGRQIAEFDPAGLNIDQVHKACDISRSEEHTSE